MDKAVHHRNFGDASVGFCGSGFQNLRSSAVNTTMNLHGIHHIAIICSDYARSKQFYVEVLGLKVIREVYREARNSFKLDLAIGDTYVIEVFSFPNPPPRVSGPEACGLRHLAVQVPDVAVAKLEVEARGIPVEPIRIDEFTGCRFTFFRDPDGLPLEIYEQPGSSLN